MKEKFYLTDPLLSPIAPHRLQSIEWMKTVTLLLPCPLVYLSLLHIPRFSKSKE